MNWTLFLLLSLFGIKHFLADFPLQFQYMVQEKGIYGARGGIHHAALHASFTFLILIFFTDNPTYIILLPLLDGVLHYHIDWSKHQLVKNYTVNDHEFWLYFGLDQTLHYLTYILIIATITL